MKSCRSRMRQWVQVGQKLLASATGVAAKNPIPPPREKVVHSRPDAKPTQMAKVPHGLPAQTIRLRTVLQTNGKVQQLRNDLGLHEVLNP